MLDKIEFGNKQFEEIARLHQNEIKKFPLILAILEGRQKGQIFSDKKGENLLIITKSGFSYGSFRENNFDEIYDYILNNKVIASYLHFYSPSDSFLEYIEQKTDKYKLRERVQYQYLGERLEYFGKYKLPEGYKLVPVQKVPFEKLEVFNLELSNKYWNSKDDFLDNAIGYVIVDETFEPAAICYSACVTSKHAEMDTLVLENHRSKGFMRLVSIPFFSAASNKGLLTHWDTFKENISSFNMGAKFNPDQTNQYKLLSVYFNKN